MILWRILADAVMGLHLLLMGFFALSVVLLASGFFKGRRGWRPFYYGVVAVAVGLGAAVWTGTLSSCPLTDVEYALRRLYDPSESWIRTRSLLGTVILNTTGVEVPEFAFTIALVAGLAVILGSLYVRRA